MSRSLLFVFVIAAGCAAKAAPPSSAPQSEPSANGGEPSGIPSSGAEVPAAGPNASAVPGVSANPGTIAPPPAEPPPGTPTLPAVSVKTIGLHVGGGPNDAEGKAPFVSSIEQHFPEFLRCYRLVSEPGKGGSFGVDLHIARTGGHARVEQPRSALAGDPFRACMVSAFESVQFPQLKKPFVISYSLRFLIEP